MSELKVGDFAIVHSQDSCDPPLGMIMQIVEIDHTDIPICGVPFMKNQKYWFFRKDLQKIELEEAHAPAATPQDNVPQPEGRIPDAR